MAETDPTSHRRNGLLVKLAALLDNDVFHWDRQQPVRARALLVAALGMAVPVLAGLIAGRLEIGLTIGLGAILLAGGPAASGPSAPPAEAPSPSTAVAPALLAVLVATAIAGTPWTDAAMIALAASAALVSGYSRPLAVAAIRFGIYLVLSLGLLDSAGTHRSGAALVFGLGALWNIAIRVMLHDRSPPEPAPTGTQAQRTPTAAQRFAHWRKGLKTLAGWQFPLRLAAGLGVASTIRHFWPAHHYFWIVLTVALLTQRPVERLPAKMVQRMAGTLAGVGVTWIILTTIDAPWALAITICLLAVAVPIARARSYIFYSTVSTPLILLVMDLGKPVGLAMLGDRLTATVLGAAIVIAGNLILAPLLPQEPARGRAKASATRSAAPFPPPA